MDLYDIAVARKLSGGSGGGGGSSDFEQITVTFATEPDYHIAGINASYNDLLALANNGKYPYIIFTEEQVSELGGDYVAGCKYALAELYTDGAYYDTAFYTLNNIGFAHSSFFEAESASENMRAG